MNSEYDMDISAEFPSASPFDFGFTITDNESYDERSEGNDTGILTAEHELNVGLIILHVFLSIMTIITVFGNCLVILAVATTRRLRSVTNCFIVSLSVSDLLVGGLVMPLSLVHEMLGFWPFGRIMCELWSSLDVMLCTASILNLCCISLDRYFAITRPLTYTVKRNKRMALGMIMVVWIASAAITCPPLLGWYNRDFEDGLKCRYVSDTSYVIYSACGSFYIPLMVMLFVYTRIFIVIYRRNKVVKHQKHYQKPTCANGCASTDDVSQSNANKPAVKLHQMKLSEDFSLRDFRLSNSDCLVSMEMVSDSLLAIRPRRESEHTKDLDNRSSSNKGKGSLYRSRSYQFQFHTNNNHKTVTTTFSNPSQSAANANSEKKSTGNSKVVEPNLNLLTVPQWSHGSAHGTTTLSSAKQQQQQPLKASTMSISVSSANNLSSTSSKSVCDSYMYPTTNTTTTSLMVDGNGSSSGASEPTGHPAKAKLSLPALGLAEGETTTLLRATRPSKDFRRKHIRGLRMSFRKETKATTTIAVVVGGFIICWMPFFIFYLAAPFCDCFMSPMLFLGLTWLGWANSAVNPFIYAFYNMDFRAAFWKLTFGRCRKEDNKSKTVVVYPQVWRSRLKGARTNGIPSIVMVQSDVM
ncbi:hypothetical protein CHUAL_008422 [Chamberlinius hualienensis]